MTKQEMIANLEYLSGGIYSVITLCNNDRWKELLDTWATLASSVASALEEENE